MSIRILIADDHTLFRAGLRALLEHEAEFEVVGEAANGRSRYLSEGIDLYPYDQTKGGKGAIAFTVRSRRSRSSSSVTEASACTSKPV